MKVKSAYIHHLSHLHDWCSLQMETKISALLSANKQQMVSL